MNTIHRLATDLARDDGHVWVALDPDARETYTRRAEIATEFMHDELLERARDEGYREAVEDIESELLGLTRRRRG